MLSFQFCNFHRKARARSPHQTSRRNVQLVTVEYGVFANGLVAANVTCCGTFHSAQSLKRRQFAFGEPCQHDRQLTGCGFWNAIRK